MKTAENKEKIKELFNESKLTILDAEFYQKQGIDIIIRGGKVYDLVNDGHGTTLLLLFLHIQVASEKT